jgi:hypothetical protein
MKEAAGSREEVAMVAVADPRQIFALLMAPLSTPYEGGGGGGRLADWPAAPSSQPFTQEGEWGEGVVVAA